MLSLVVVCGVLLYVEVQFIEAAHCGGFSCGGALALRHGLNKCGTRA